MAVEWLKGTLNSVPTFGSIQNFGLDLILQNEELFRHCVAMILNVYMAVLFKVLTGCELLVIKVYFLFIFLQYYSHQYWMGWINYY